MSSSCYPFPLPWQRAGEGAVYISATGIDWEEAAVPGLGLSYGITWGNDKFIYVGAGGSILASADGRTWTECASGVEGDLEDAAWGEDLFVAVGEKGLRLTAPTGQSKSPAQLSISLR